MILQISMACIRWATVVKQKIYLMGHSIDLYSAFMAINVRLVLLFQYIFFKVCVVSLLLILNII